MEDVRIKSLMFPPELCYDYKVGEKVYWYIEKLDEVWKGEVIADKGDLYVVVWEEFVVFSHYKTSTKPNEVSSFGRTKDYYIYT